MREGEEIISHLPEGDMRELGSAEREVQRVSQASGSFSDFTATCG